MPRPLRIEFEGALYHVMARGNARAAIFLEGRDQAIRRAYATGGYTLAEIGAHFGLHYSMISRVVRGRLVAKQRRQVAGDSK